MTSWSSPGRILTREHLSLLGLSSWRDSETVAFFSQALPTGLLSPDLSPSHLVQYVNDLQFSPSLALSQQHITQLLSYLGDNAYRVSSSEAQLPVLLSRHPVIP